MTLMIREMDEDDVDQVIKIYKKCYGSEYPYQEFYGPNWIKKGIYSDDTNFLVADSDGEILGSGSVLLEAGDHDDLMGEFGRLAVNPSEHHHGIGNKISMAMDEGASQYIEFGFAEARTVNQGPQKLLDKGGFSPIGFEPHKYRLKDRESFILYGKLYGHAEKLRREEPIIIPEVAPLAKLALEGMGLGSDILIDHHVGRYPSANDLTTEDITEFLMPRLLKIAYGRVLKPEVFGSIHLNYGYFKIKSQNAHYLIATRGFNQVGAVGYTVDNVDFKVKIFELVATDDFVKGFLLDKVDAQAINNGALYIEADVSAYSPRIQRTFIDLGYKPVAYCPSMVFQDTERLDLVRFAKVNTPVRLDNLQIKDSSKPIYKVVAKQYGW